MSKFHVCSLCIEETAEGCICSAQSGGQKVNGQTTIVVDDPYKPYQHKNMDTNQWSRSYSTHGTELWSKEFVIATSKQILTLFVQGLMAWAYMKMKRFCTNEDEDEEILGKKCSNPISISGLHNEFHVRFCT